MVYLTVGVLVASLSFLIYRHPPVSWVPLLGPWRRKSGLVAIDRVGLEDVDEKAQTRSDESNEKAEEDTSVAPQPGTPTSLSPHNSLTSPDSTPKGALGNGSKLSAIPSMYLNDSHLPQDTSVQTSSRECLSTQLPPAPTLRPFTQPKYVQPSATSMPPPPRPPPKPSLPRATPPSPSPASKLRAPPPSAASTLRAPSSKSAPNNSLAPTTSTQPPSSRKSKKVILSPGHSPLDWALLTKSPASSSNLRGVNVPPHLIRVPPSLLKHMNGRKGRDAWSVWQGKVYNITPYLPFHPGGDGELMRGAGKEAGKLFNEVHPWVNWEGMLAECLVGVLVDEGDDRVGKGGGSLDEMD
ncbi:hypothetical protein MMC16_004155 [Acarospora aff. strigata]|nr:hypothetical protein [Acarospora aff. strigata]